MSFKMRNKTEGKKRTRLRYRTSLRSFFGVYRQLNYLACRILRNSGIWRQIHTVVLKGVNKYYTGIRILWAHLLVMQKPMLGRI